MAIPIENERYEMLTFIRIIGRKNSRYLYEFRCDCGNTKIINSSNWKKIKSCGCLKSKGQGAFKHGYASHKKYDRLYHTWNGIKSRCYNKNSKDYKHYGGRGITMCHEWLENFMAFRNWALENGYSDSLTIDRINVNGNYCPENCRWASVAEQNRNKTTTLNNRRKEA